MEALHEVDMQGLTVAICKPEAAIAAIPKKLDSRETYNPQAGVNVLIKIRQH